MLKSGRYSLFNKVVLLFFTVKYLRFSQIYYRIYKYIKRIEVASSQQPISSRSWLKSWDGECFRELSTRDGVTFRFLNETHSLADDWNSPKPSKLWLYNLHYQDDLNAIEADDSRELCVSLVERWIDNNPAMKGNGWEPYCLSLRVVNWVKWLSRQSSPNIQARWLESLSMQASALEKQIEYDILANHLFANAKALVFVGAYVGGPEGERWLSKGLNLLDKELAEQFLDDGGHFELSPMYHSIMIWDVCELIKLALCSDIPQLQTRVCDWSKVVSKGLEWFDGMVHFDGDVSFFNDSAFDIAPQLADIQQYAAKLGIKEYQTALSNYGFTVRNFSETGYLIIDWPREHRLISDIGFVGADYQPGHAHADVLSFELSVFGQRLFVNSGTSVYGTGPERHRQRSTCAHNTVEVNGENSSEVWAGFRVARRARPTLFDITNKADEIIIRAGHDGYQHLPGGIFHQRSWCAEGSGLRIEDTIEGECSSAIARFHLHPLVNASVNNDGAVEVTLPLGQQLKVCCAGGQVRLRKSTWHPRFGQSIPNICIEVDIVEGQLRTDVCWG